MEKENEETIASLLSSIDNSLKLQISKRQMFVQGLIRGFGTALGATVLLALATSLTLNMFGAVGADFFASYFANEVVSE